MTGLVERVAKAIWDDACPGMEWGDIDKMSYEGWAREALGATADYIAEVYGDLHPGAVCIRSALSNGEHHGG